MTPFIDDQRGATMRHQAHKAKSVIQDTVLADAITPHEDYLKRLAEREARKSAAPKHFWQSRTIWVIASFVVIALFLTACASPYNHPGTPRTPDPAYEDLFEGTES